MQMLRESGNQGGDISWVFFASGAKPTSMRRAAAERLAENEQVIIVDWAISLLRDRKAPQMKARCQRLPGIGGFWRYRPLHYPERLPWIGRIIKDFNQRRLRRELSQLLPRDFMRIVCFDSPMQENLVGKLREDISIYLAIDDLTITLTGQGIKGELEAEKRMLGKVDLAICVSEILAQRLRGRSPSTKNPPINVLPNGYDEHIFHVNYNWPEQEAIRGIPRPRMLVTGHVSERIDWEGISEASRLRPQWNWIFVGPADKGMQEKIRTLLRDQGFYHPAIRVQDVPAWIAHCDACAVPYRLNNFTLASSPLKAIEYLAMGASVLSTRVPSLAQFKNVIQWVEEGVGESYAQALDRVISEGRNQFHLQARCSAVRDHSWAIKTKELRKMVLSVAASGTRKKADM